MNDRKDYLIFFIILFVLALSYKIYTESDMFNLVCIVSDVDHN